MAEVNATLGISPHSILTSVSSVGQDIKKKFCLKDFSKFLLKQFSGKNLDGFSSNLEQVGNYLYQNQWKPKYRNCWRIASELQNKNSTGPRIVKDNEIFHRYLKIKTSEYKSLCARRKRQRWRKVPKVMWHN